MSEEEAMSGHGHVTPNADGSKARCGGPSSCRECASELAASVAAKEKQAQRPAETPTVTDLAAKYQIAFDALIEIRNLDRSTWKPEAIKAHEALTRLGWRP